MQKDDSKTICEYCYGSEACHHLSDEEKSKLSNEITDLWDRILLTNANPSFLKNLSKNM